MVVRRITGKTAAASLAVAPAPGCESPPAAAAGAAPLAAAWMPRGGATPAPAASAAVLPAGGGGSDPLLSPNAAPPPKSPSAPARADADALSAAAVSASAASSFWLRLCCSAATKIPLAHRRSRRRVAPTFLSADEALAEPGSGVDHTAGRWAPPDRPNDASQAGGGFSGGRRHAL